MRSRQTKQVSPGRTRLFWKLGGSLLAAVALVGSAQGTISQIAHDRHTLESSLAAQRVSELVVELDAGTVEVVVTESDQVAITAEVTDGLFRTDVSQDLDQGTLRLTGRCSVLSRFCGVDYRVEIPADVPVDLSSRNGQIRVFERSAAVAASTDNGNVELRGLQGPLVASATNGNVSALDVSSGETQVRVRSGHVSLEYSQAPRHVEARSHNGNVTVMVPEGPTAYSTDTDTGSGSVTEQVRVDPDSDRRISARSSHGDVTISYR